MTSTTSQPPPSQSATLVQQEKVLAPRKSLISFLTPEVASYFVGIVFIFVRYRIPDLSVPQRVDVPVLHLAR